MKKVLNIVFVCVAVLSSCAKTINDDTNYYYINGEPYYRVPFDCFDGYEDEKGYIQTFQYSNTGVKTLNPGYFRCDFCDYLPSLILRNRLDQLNKQHNDDPNFTSDNRKYYLIAELAFIRHKGTHRVNVSGIFSPWRIAIGRPKMILINQGLGDEKIEVIEIIDDYVE